MLAWTNVSDLQANSTFTITYEAKWPNAGSIPLTSRQQTSTTRPWPARPTHARSRSTQTAHRPMRPTPANDSETTKRAPFIIEKSEPSPEGELLRGVHKKRTVYTLKISNNKAKSTEKHHGHRLPARRFEFLGCGDEDNTQPITEKGGTRGRPFGCPTIQRPDVPRDIPPRPPRSTQSWPIQQGDPLKTGRRVDEGRTDHWNTGTRQ